MMVRFYIILDIFLLSCMVKCQTSSNIRQQIRVIKEAHALDISSLYDEIDSLKDVLREMSDQINRTHDMLTVTHTGNYEEDISDNTQGFQHFEDSNQLDTSAMMRKGIKSSKTWFIMELRAVKQTVSSFKEDLAIKTAELADKINSLDNLVSENHALFERFQEELTALHEKLVENKNMVRDIENTCLTEIEKRYTENENQFIELRSQIEKINERGPMYTINKDEWIVVFRAQAGNGVSVYDAWRYNRGTVDVLSNTNAKSHYRHSAVQRWKDIQVVLVRVALYENGKEVAFILFDGDRSDNMNWFSKERILDSSWNHLRYDSALNVASIIGVGNRRFYINTRYGGCENDHGFMLLLDNGPSPCIYEKILKQPQIMYAKFPGGTRWDSMLHGRADSMTISIKPKDLF